jgi:hypothetical protein
VRITLGAVAPGELVELDITAPSGLNLTAVTRAIVVSLQQHEQAPVTIGPWTTVSTTASLWRVRYAPNGSEFSAIGPCRLLPDVTLDGVLYRYAAVRGDIIPR